MRTVKPFGICILFLLVAVSVYANQVNETMLNQLLNAYGSDYDDGSFSVVLDKATDADQGPSGPNWDAGNYSFKFNITGSGAYITTATLTRHLPILNGWIEYGKVFDTKPGLGNDRIRFTFSGNYLDCYGTKTVYVDFKIYQNNVLHYQKMFEKNFNCDTTAIYFNEYGTNHIDGIEKGAPAGFEELQLNLSMCFPERKDLVVGAYIWDNKTGIAYTEKKVIMTGNYDFTLTDCPYGYGINKTISLRYNVSQLKNFELTDERILLKEIVVNNQTVDYPWAIPDYNRVTQLSSFTTPSDFNYQSIYINSYQFKEDKSNNKIKNLNVTLNNNGYSGTYNVELSLENQYGEVVLTNKINNVNTWPATISFNGTEIYQSKINGPYRLGFIRITDLSGNELFYKTNKGLSKELTYMNFTSPDMPDLEINNSDIKGDKKNVNVTIYNKGTGDAVGITISLFKNDASKAKEIILDKLLAGDNTTYYFNNINLSSGFVFIDFVNSVEESNESNNVAELIPTGPNDVPKILSSPKTTAVRGLQYSYLMIATDNDTIYYSVNDSRFNVNGNNFTWTPNENEFGTKYFTFTVTDNENSSTKQAAIKLLEDAYILRAATLDYAEKDAERYTYINSNITINSQTGASVGANHTNFTVSSNTEYPITHSKSGYKSETDYVYFDERLTTCTEKQNCTLGAPNSHTTVCKWEPLKNNWYCSIKGGILPKETWFRYERTPNHDVRRVNYLLR